MKGRIKVEDVFMITGRGVVITGSLVEGTINNGDSLRLGDNFAQIKGIESFRKMANIVDNVGQNIGILLGLSFTKEYIQTFKGDVLDITTKADVRQDKLNELGI